VIFFPFLASYFITPYERDLRRNCLAVRNLIGQLIDQRRSEIEIKSSNKGDLLSLLLEDPLFSQNNEIIIDELLTIFFAGSQTSANVTQNLILHLCK
jgi:cytochrome P450